MSNRGLLVGVIIVASSVLMCGCEAPETVTGTLDGNYAYTGFDSTGNPIVSGSLTMIRKDSASITGSWYLRAIGNPSNIGPQVGTGSLVGRFHQYSGGYDLSVGLNPSWVDNNIFLTGKIENDVFKGEWQWISFAGLTNKGTFRARRLLPD